MRPTLLLCLSGLLLSVGCSSSATEGSSDEPSSDSAITESQATSSDGSECAAPEDCDSGVCVEEICAEPTCVDEVRNGDETDVDCGGSCPPCDDGSDCAAPEDCDSGVCVEEICAEPTCVDEVRNGDETDVDCGGSCPPCDDGSDCAAPEDCDSGVCVEEICAEPTCVDEVRNGDETDVDCGGSCPPCDDGRECGAPEDCDGGICFEEFCARDSDGDGVIDAYDLCPETPPSATVDPAGCVDECDAQVIGGDAFARTLLTQIGLNLTGSFGSIGLAPVGYSPRSDGSGGRELGMVADPHRTGWLAGEFHGDFLLAGTPEEGWGITWVDGEGRTGNVNNNASGLMSEVVGAIIKSECVPAGLGPGGRGGARIVWRGTWRNGTPPHSLEVEQEATVLHEGLFVLMNVTLTNISAADLEIYYMRNVDPDNNQTIGCGFETLNTIVSQRPPLGTSDHALVSAEQPGSLGPNCASYMALAARDVEPAVVTYGGFANRDARAVYDGLGFTQEVGESLSVDNAISLATRHELAAGDSVRLSYVYLLSESAMDDAWDALVESSDASD
ncbi:MAG: hypothetical protein EA397_04810 [Deltaproteobacteria bacterium]|nr:MAG: hypothetical protein EA397_04810 [Deltaproteobacteria bacterium]